MAASRDYMLERLIKMKQETGSISEDAIKKDPLLSLYEVRREFGNVEKAKKIVKALLKDQVDTPKEKVPDKEKTVKSASEFREIMKKAIRKQKPDDIVTTEVKQQSAGDTIVDAEEKQREAENMKIGSEPKVELKDAKEKDGEKMGMTKDFSYENVYREVAELAKSSGRIPTQAQIREQSKLRSDFPSYNTVFRLLGNGWQKKMAEELGLTFSEKPATKPKKVAKPTVKTPETGDTTNTNSSNKTTSEKDPLKDWIVELAHEYGIKIDKVVKTGEEATRIISEALEAITSAAKAFSEFEASKMLQYDMEGGGTTMIYILSSK